MYSLTDSVEFGKRDIGILFLFYTQLSEGLISMFLETEIMKYFLKSEFYVV